MTMTSCVNNTHINAVIIHFVFINDYIQILKTKIYIVHRLSVTISVHKKVREVEELGNKFFDVIWIFHQALPHGRNGVKLPVSYVKPTNNINTHSVINMTDWLSMITSAMLARLTDFKPESVHHHITTHYKLHAFV